MLDKAHNAPSAAEAGIARLCAAGSLTSSVQSVHSGRWRAATIAAGSTPSYGHCWSEAGSALVIEGGWPVIGQVFPFEKTCAASRRSRGIPN